MVSFTLRPLFPNEGAAAAHRIGGLVGIKTVWEFWKEGTHAPAVNRTAFLDRSARSRVMIGTE